MFRLRGTTMDHNALAEQVCTCTSLACIQAGCSYRPSTSCPTGACTYVLVLHKGRTRVYHPQPLSQLYCRAICAHIVLAFATGSCLDCVPHVGVTMFSCVFGSTLVSQTVVSVSLPGDVSCVLLPSAPVGPLL